MDEVSREQDREYSWFSWRTVCKTFTGKVLFHLTVWKFLDGWTAISWNKICVKLDILSHYFASSMILTRWLHPGNSELVHCIGPPSSLGLQESWAFFPGHLSWLVAKAVPFTVRLPPIWMLGGLYFGPPYLSHHLSYWHAHTGKHAQSACPLIVHKEASPYNPTSGILGKWLHCIPDNGPFIPLLSCRSPYFWSKEGGYVLLLESGKRDFCASGALSSYPVAMHFPPRTQHEAF